MEPTKGDVTRLLRKWRGGDEQALDDLMPLVYEELRRLARRFMNAERPGHTLQTTALVHEACIRLIEADVPYQDRVHFLAVAARSMRRILVDHARAARAAKRGGPAPRLTLEEALVVSDAPTPDLIDLDLALDRLAVQDERKARAVELYYFGGLPHQEVAQALGVSTATVRADLRFAKVWLLRELDPEANGGA